MLIAFLIIIWIIGAVVTVKADAMLANDKSDWAFNLIASLFIWPVIAVLICCSKHEVCRGCYRQHREYHY